MRLKGSNFSAGWAPIAALAVVVWLLTAGPSWAAWPQFVQVLAVLGAALSLWCGAVFAIIAVALLAYTSRLTIRGLRAAPAEI